LKSETIIKKVVGRQYTFTGSEKDLDLLRSLVEGKCIHTKPGDPNFHAYAAAMNTTTEFGEQALEVLELIPFNNQLAHLQDEYMSSYPPMNPVTTSFFAAWMVLDAQDGLTGMTLGGFLWTLPGVAKWPQSRIAGLPEVRQVPWLLAGVRFSGLQQSYRQCDLRCRDSGQARFTAAFRKRTRTIEIIA
jgi:hypothetical protein